MTWTWEIYHETVESDGLDPLQNGCRCARCRREIPPAVETENVVPLRLGDRVRIPGEDFDRRIIVTHSSGGKTESLDESELAAGVIYEPGTGGLDELEAGAAEGGPADGPETAGSTTPEGDATLPASADPDLDADEAARLRAAVARGRAAAPAIELRPHPGSIAFATELVDRICDCGWLGNERSLVWQPFTDPACPACGNWSTVAKAAPEPIEAPPASRAGR